MEMILIDTTTGKYVKKTDKVDNTHLYRFVEKSVEVDNTPSTDDGTSTDS